MTVLPPLHPLETHLLAAISGLERASSPVERAGLVLEELFEAQARSRIVDHTARFMRAEGRGYYTIGSAGHESNAAVALAVQPTDPALLHYRSGGFYVARAAQHNQAQRDQAQRDQTQRDAAPRDQAQRDAAPRDDAQQTDTIIDPVEDMIKGMLAHADEPIAGGRHKVFGRAELSVIPQTSTIASHLPRAVGLALAIGAADDRQATLRWASDALVVCSFGDASLNHSTAQGALNWAAYEAHRGACVPVVFVCEDNGLGISVPTPAAWTGRSISARPLAHMGVDGRDPIAVFDAMTALAALAREGQPGLLQLRTVRFLGHAGSDVESAYRSPAEIKAEMAMDPIIGTAQRVVDLGICRGEDLADWYLDERSCIWDQATALMDESHRELSSSREIMEPLGITRPGPIARAVEMLLDPPAPADDLVEDGETAEWLDDVHVAGDLAGTDFDAGDLDGADFDSADFDAGDLDDRDLDGEALQRELEAVEAMEDLVLPVVATLPRSQPNSPPDPVAPLPEADASNQPGLPLTRTLAQSINETLAEILDARPEALVFGEDVGRKGGVYGVTRGLQAKFGDTRVFDTLLDEQSILGLANGAAVAGHLPIPEIQFLAYVHNAADQIRGEAATLQFFSKQQFTNPMVIRIAGYGYQRGFGGHFHNDNSIAALLDLPGVVVASPSHPSDAAALLRTCTGAALADGVVSIFLEPIARYHTTDLFEEGDGLWAEPHDVGHVSVGTARTHGDGTDLTLVTWGNGLYLSLRAQRELHAEGIATRVVDLRWLNPLPMSDLLRDAEATGRVLVVDETRHQGGVGQSVVANLVEAGFGGALHRLAANNSFVPLGAAADLVLVSQNDIVAAARWCMEASASRVFREAID